ncbi:hypothetical protein PsAD13_00953 [Pseudovibrio sp. Ad13]|uniref:hypothetical protein n=1 Tax=Pseudovibrio sp. Ad13 TaxID=989396 RepID=UPI0007AE4F82|nr:hypothetical protein [Pseudovibrio sp. Ad13]KZK86672.1 hypothetical protein PsAD13_00953 [Pseudovibrio sp. Ad13]
MSISSIKNSLLAFLIVELVFISICFQQVRENVRNDARKNLEFLSEVALHTDGDSESIAREEFLFISRQSGQILEEILGEFDESTVLSNSQYEMAGFPKKIVSDGYKKNLQLRDLSLGECTVIGAVTELADRRDDYIFLGQYLKWSSIDVPYVTSFDASDCVNNSTGMPFIGAFIGAQGRSPEFFVIDENYLRMLPSELRYRFVAEEYKMSEDILQQLNKNPVYRYLSLKDNSYVIPMSLFKWGLLDKISEITGQKYKQEYLIVAVEDLYAAQSKEASISGINAPRGLILSFSPFIFLIWIWTIYRKANHFNGDEQSDYWIALDVNDFVGKSIALAYAVTLYILSITAAMFYFSAVELKLPISLLIEEINWEIHVDASLNLIIDDGSRLKWLHSMFSLNALSSFAWFAIIILSFFLAIRLLSISASHVKCTKDAVLDEIQD